MSKENILTDVIISENRYMHIADLEARLDEIRISLRSAEQSLEALISWMNAAPQQKGK